MATRGHEKTPKNTKKIKLTVHGPKLEHHKFDGCAQSGFLLQKFDFLEESVSNSRSDQLKKALRSVQD